MVQHIHPTFFTRLDMMSLQLKRHAFGKYQGEQRTVYAGDGLTFKDFAPYTLGDDFRRIDWRVYAKTHELFVKRYEEDRNLTIHMLVDVSGSMEYGKVITKIGYAATMALGVVYIAQKNHERATFSVFSHNLRTLKHENQNKTVHQLVSEVNAIKAHGDTDFTKVLNQYHSQIKSKSLFFIFSDFLYPVDKLARLLKRYEKHQVFLVQVLHADEVALPFKGPTKFIDPENIKNKVKLHVSPRMRTYYSKQLREHNDAIKNMCKSFNAQFLELNTGITDVKGFTQLWKLLS